MATTKQLTDVTIKNLKPKPGERPEVFEGHGFGVRVESTGRKTFNYLYRMKGEKRKRRLILGVYDGNEQDKAQTPEKTPDGYLLMTLAEARKAHAEAMDKVRKGIDPGAQAAAEKKADREAMTVGALIRRFNENYLGDPSRKLSPKTIREHRRILAKDVEPLWRDRKARDITRQDVIDLLEPIRKRGGVIYNRTIASISKLFTYAAYELGIIDNSPCLKMKRVDETPRQRYLKSDEIRVFWQFLNDAKMAEGIKLALKLQLVTGQRKIEVLRAEQDEIDLTERIWTIPNTPCPCGCATSKAKNKQTQRVPLTDLALDLIEKARELAGDSPWPFPSHVKEGKHLHPESVNSALTKALNGQEELRKFNPHDLRRTVATLMAGAGEQMEIEESLISKVMNHKKGDVTQNHYIVYGYDKQKRKALEAWEKVLLRIINPEDNPPAKVLPFRR